MKVESHQPSSTMFHTPALTGLPGGGRRGKKKKKKKKLHKQPWSCVPSQFISQAKSGWLSCGKEGGSVTSACPGLLTLQGSGSTLTKARPPQPPATPSRSSRGLSFTHLISQGAGHGPDRPANKLSIRFPHVQNIMLDTAVSAWPVSRTESYGLRLRHVAFF